MITPYSNKNAKFTDKAHKSAQTILYPKIFNGNELIFDDLTDWETPQNEILDGQMGVDKIIKVSTDRFKEPFTFTIQERFRQIKFASYRDLTITEWNNSSDLPSELYKITAGLFVYGYFDDTNEKFGEVIVIDTTLTLYKLSQQKLQYKSDFNPRSNQTFITLKFEDLINSNLVVYHYNKPQNGLFDW